MRKNEVQVGHVYRAKVSGKLTRVKVTGVSPYGGWDGLNLLTKKPVRIRSAQRLRYEVDGCGQPVEPPGPVDCGREHPQRLCVCKACLAEFLRLHRADPTTLTPHEHALLLARLAAEGRLSEPTESERLGQ